MPKTYTLTYGDVCENHVGMEKIGELSVDGLSIECLNNIAKQFPKYSELINLQHNPTYPPAVLLIIRNGVNLLTNGAYEELYAEQSALNPDTKAFMRGRIVNKLARYNLCFSNEGHDPDFANGKGTVIEFQKVPLTRELKNILEKLFSVSNLQCEGNYYYDTSKSTVGIQSHGDTERKIVIGVRLGDPMPLQFCWFKNFKPISEHFRITLNGGDIYAMSSKAVGCDWKRSSIPTLRHAAGSEDFLNKEIERIKTKSGVLTDLVCIN